MTSAELIILGMLAEEDCYGYQIEAKIKERNIRYWAEIGFIERSSLSIDSRHLARAFTPFSCCR